MEIQRTPPIDGFSDDPWTHKNVPIEDAAANITEIQSLSKADGNTEFDKANFLNELVINGAMEAIENNGPFLKQNTAIPVKFMVDDIEAQATNYPSTVASTNSLNAKGSYDGEFVPSVTIFQGNMHKHYSENSL